MPEYPLAGPRMAVAPDGSIHFYDEKGDPIKSKKVTGDNFLDMINENGIRHIRHASIYFFEPGSNCRVIYEIPPYGTFCFWVDCTTGKYISQC